jgi:hypothetical protein
MSNLQKTNQAFKRRETFIQLHGRIRLTEIKLLYEIWANKDWNQLGFESFGDYMEAPEISGGLDISRSWAIQLIKAYQKYIVELGWDEDIFIKTSPRKLYELAGQATKNNQKDILNQATTLSLIDLQKNRKNIDEVNCQHLNLEYIGHCKDCGQWLKNV